MGGPRCCSGRLWQKAPSDSDVNPQDGELTERPLPTSFTRKEVEEALSLAEEEEERVSLAGLHEALRRVCKTAQPLEADDEAADGLLQRGERGGGPPDRRGFTTNTAVSVVVMVGTAALVLWCGFEPLQWGGLMYRRHWCGVVIDEGGNGCLQMAAENFKSR